MLRTQSIAFEQTADDATWHFGENKLPSTSTSTSTSVSLSAGAEAPRKAHGASRKPILAPERKLLLKTQAPRRKTSPRGGSPGSHASCAGTHLGRAAERTLQEQPLNLRGGHMPAEHGVQGLPLRLEVSGLSLEHVRVLELSLLVAHLE